jgi:uncharacterized protein (TIGR02594 family)
MNIPAQYQWLQELPTLPKTISLALKELGVAEVVGRGSNKTIIAWRDELNLAGVKISGYSDDSIPWCGLFVAIIAFRRMGVAAEVVVDPLWARNWATYGKKSDKASLGDVLVFVRNGGGHVGFYLGEDKYCYHVLGGNQSDKVCITRIEKSRCIAVRRPPYKISPDAVKPTLLSAKGMVSKNVSKNEA